MAVCALTLTTCSSGDETSEPSTVTTTPATLIVASTTSTTTTRASPATATLPTITAVPATTATAAGTTAAALGQADIDAIAAAFHTFFGGQHSTLDEKVAVLDNGEQHRDMLEAGSGDTQFQQLTTDIRTVRAGSDGECAELGVPAGCAIVVHDLLVGGFPMAASISSPAVRHDGVWLVGAQAWCNVVEIGGAACPTEPARIGSNP